MIPNRIVIVGGSGRGKSTLAEEYRREGHAVFCGDPKSAVEEPLAHVTYLQEGLDYAGDYGGAAWVVRNWLSGIGMPARWVLEGHVMARALRRWMESATRTRAPFPCDQVVVLDGANLRAGTAHHKPGQDPQHKGVMTTWGDIADYYRPITQWGK